MSGGKVVAAGDHVEQPGPELGGLGVGVERPLVRQHVHPQPEYATLVGDGQFALHVVIAGEAGGDEVFGAAFHPLHRLADEQGCRGGHHIAGVDGHLVAEPAADVGAHDADVLLRQSGHHGEQRPVGVGGLRGHVDGGLSGHRVHVGHDAARLQRSGVRAGIVGLQGDHPIGLGKGLFGGALVAGLPGVGQIVGLALLLVPDQRRPLFQGLLGRGDGRQLLVVHHDVLEGVSGDVGIGGDHRGHLLALVAHLVGGQHRLGIARQGGHPGQSVLVHQIAGDHGQHPVDGGGRRGVDAVDAGVGQRRAQDGHVQRVGQVDVVEEVALTLNEPGVFFALDAMADAADLSGSSWCSHDCSSASVGRLGHSGRCRLDGLDDVDVAGAPAQVSRDGPAHLVI